MYENEVKSTFRGVKVFISSPLPSLSLYSLPSSPDCRGGSYASWDPYSRLFEVFFFFLSLLLLLITPLFPPSLLSKESISLTPLFSLLLLFSLSSRDANFKGISAIFTHEEAFTKGPKYNKKFLFKIVDEKVRYGLVCQRGKE